MTVSRSTVIWAFRMLLGRDPRSEEAIAAHMRAPSVDSLRETIMRSPEFREVIARKIPASGTVDDVDLASGPLRVEWRGSQRQLLACIRRVRRSWQRLGNEKPFYSVLTDQRFLPDTFVHHQADFWSSGEQDVRALVALLTLHGIRNLNESVCFELGCGVGRLTIPLTRRFSRVVGLDVSRDHIAIAERHTASLHIQNVGFRYCGNLNERWLGKCDVYYSRLVLQHNPPPLMAEFIRRGLCALKPGGLAVLQVPTYRSGYDFDLVKWLGESIEGKIEMHCLPQSAVFELSHRCRCSLAEVRSDYAAGPEYISKVFVIRKPGRERRAGRRTIQLGGHK